MKTLFLFTIFVSLAFFCFNFKFLVGGYTKIDFKNKDEDLRKGLWALKERITKTYGVRADVVEVAVYSQETEVPKFKFITALRDPTNKSVSLQVSDVIIYSSALDPKISIDTLSQNNFLDDESKTNDIIEQIEKYLTKRRGTLVEILDVEAHPELVYDDGFYIVEAKIEIDD
jgi:hypothetical protein